MKLILMLPALILGGCAGSAYDASQLKSPPKWAMAKKCYLPVRPVSDGDPVARAEYESALRRCAARRGDQVDGLQGYVRTATSKK